LREPQQLIGGGKDQPQYPKREGEGGDNKGKKDVYLLKRRMPRKKAKKEVGK